MKIDSLITIGKGEMSRRQWERLFTTLTFADAGDNEVSAFQYMSGRDIVLLPRGVWDMLPAKLDVTDLRSRPTMPKLAYMRTLDAPGYEGQSKAVAAMFKHQQGRVIAPPGRGKTEICLAFAAASRTRVLVIVHTHDLFKQWQDRAKESVPGMSLGKIQGKTCQVEHLTIATAQTLKKYLDAGGKFWRQFGAVIVDEAHHAAADTWEWLLNTCPAYYRFGVTASEKRSDGRHPLVRFNIGPVIYKMKFKSQVPMSVVPIQTGFKCKYNGTQYNQILHELVNDEDRNALIARKAQREVENGSAVLVLSRQIAHLENIKALMPESVGTVVVTGKLARTKRDKMIQGLRDGSIDCILGTQLFEEGVDIPRLNRIALAFPGTEITALQKVGRGARQYKDKTETIVYDYLDDYVRVLAKQYLRRRAWYKSVGIKVEGVKKHAKKGKGAAKAKAGRKFLNHFQVARPARG
jgi:superfamily II DNA or RNA helicase